MPYVRISIPEFKFCHKKFLKVKFSFNFRRGILLSESTKMSKKPEILYFHGKNACHTSIKYDTITQMTSGGPLASGNEHQEILGGISQMADIIDQINRENLKAETPSFNIGDTVKVSVKVVEGARERIQIFEGVVIAKRHGSISETFTVRRLSFGIGVERTFPVHSPKITKVEVSRKGKVRRAKLYYLRGRTGKAAKVREVL